MTTEQTGQSPKRRAWQWYHFYFVLALFDILVIIASLALHHRTLRTYEVSLGELGQVDAAEKFVSDLRSAVIALNAPGNDVFQTRRSAEERQRSEQMRRSVRNTLRTLPERPLDLTGFDAEIAEMTSAQDRIFDFFDRLDDSTLNTNEAQPMLESASATMATMDQHQAAALDILDHVGAVLRHDKDQLYREYGATLHRRSGLERLFLVVVIGILIGVLWYGRKLHQTHEQMRKEQARGRQERQDRLAAIGELCSAFAHGIRNPLAVIKSSAQIALKYPSIDDPILSRVREVLDACQRLERRCTRLLEFAREPLHGFEQYDLTHDLRQAIDEIASRLDAHDIRVTSSFAIEPLEVFGDRERIVQSMIELLSNAIDHLPSGGHVNVDCRLHTDHTSAIIDITDDGPGIPEPIRDRVFDLFFTSKPDGGGIGLASVKRAVDLHHGTVRIMPSQSGAHIRIELPLNGSQSR
jgi:signal transduction histidine kinase